MRQLKNLVHGLRSLINRQRANGEIDEEIDGFLEASAAHKQQNGMSPEQARHAALVEMGSRNTLKHRVWSVWWESAAENLLKDVQLGLRSLAKRPAFTLVALLSLALGIGANTAIFTLIQQVLLSELPVRSPNELVTLGDATNSGIAGGVDVGQYGFFPWYAARQLEANPGPFQGIASFGSFLAKVSVRLPGAAGASQQAQLAAAGLVSGNYFKVLGAHAFLGRTLSPADDSTPDTGAVVVVSFHYWQSVLSSDPAILGKTLTINGTPFEVVGVMPPGFEGLKIGLDLADVWTPSTMQTVILQKPSMLTPNSGLFFLNMFARLSPKAAADPHVRAQSQLWLEQQVHSMIRAGEGGTISAARQKEIEHETIPLVPASHGVSYLHDTYRQSLWVLMAVVVLVLLIACANLANFLLARAATRQREIATRLALGSSRARIVRQSLIETLILSLGGGILGLAFAFAATRALIAFVSEGNAWIALSPAPNATVLLFTLGMSLATGALFGIGPALAITRTAAQHSLSSSSRTAGGGRSKAARWWPKSLIVGQVMLSLLLLVTAGFFLQTLRNLQHQDFGFERNFLLLARFDARLAGYSPVQTAALHQRLIDRLSSIPGVQSVALAETPPISSGNWRSNISLSGYTPAPKENMNSVLNRVSGRYFETTGISIVSGRAISATDTANSLKVAVVNEALARRFFPKGNAIGQTLTIGIDSVKGPWQIVGIARDTKASNPRNEKPELMTYIPLAQIDAFLPADAAAPSAPKQENQDRYASFILLRTSGAPSARIADLRAAIASVDPHLPLIDVSTIGEDVARMMGKEELSSSLTSIFAVLALLLAAIGLFGVMNYNVAQRTNEMGVRLALGAQRQNVLWIVLREALLLLSLGAGLGLPLSWAASRYVRDQLFGLKADDPLTYAGALIVVSCVVLLSAWIPARRAAAINPVDALRYE
ncbi:MAG TPA: ABC transporter permease [Terracidiphilus sp.]|nr:ABC transporter permease [Terracidiphilus sp.]